MSIRVIGLRAPCVLTLILSAATVAAQAPASARLAILQAEDRRAPTPHDLAIIRGGLRSADPETALAAVRALGRLERPALAGDIVPSLRHALPEVRAAAADALGQAAAGWKTPPAPGALAPIVRALDGRLDVEADADVRAAICETLGRLPYAAAADVAAAEHTLVRRLAQHPSIEDRVGVAAGLEQLVRHQHKSRAPEADTISALMDLAAIGEGESTSGARIRRLAIEALTPLGPLDREAIARWMKDPDAQVRRLAIRAAGMPRKESGAASHDGSPMSSILTGAMADEAAMVRLEAVRGLRNAIGDDEACPLLVRALKDRDTHVDLMVLDQLATCGGSADAMTALQQTIGDRSQLGEPRGWHRAAHALVALAHADKTRAAAALPQFIESRTWQVRMYAARAAAILGDRDALDTLAADPDDNVCEAAIDGLAKVSGHGADGRYVAALARRGHQAQRAAAIALAGTPAPETAIPALKSTLHRLVDEGFDNSHDARSAIRATLAKLGAPAPPAKGRVELRSSDLNADDLRRLASPRARVTISGVGIFDVALFTTDAPATVLRFAHLAETGYYNGLTFHRIVPNFVIQGGSPGANEYVGDSWFMRDELGLWPHVRGAVGISTRGRDTGDAQIFVDTVDNPRLDHDYTVFGQVLNGIEIVDRILEGDVIERIEIIP